MSRMCSSVDVNEKETIFLKRNRKRVIGTWSLRLPKDPRLSPVRPRPLSDNTDSHRAKAVQDCIEFLHSSSSRESLS
ncbi:hypothetical protein HN51_057711 [Arachis hypogaea]